MTDKLSFEEIEDCFPDGAFSSDDGYTKVSAQWLHDFARNIQERIAAQQWQPIETAPWEREVLITGESGYVKPHDLFFINAYREKDWHQGEWNDATGTHLSERGWENPTHWIELPIAAQQVPVSASAGDGIAGVESRKVDSAADVKNHAATPAVAATTCPQCGRIDAWNRRDPAIIALIEAVDALDEELKKRDIAEVGTIPWRSINRIMKARKAFGELQ